MNRQNLIKNLPRWGIIGLIILLVPMITLATSYTQRNISSESRLQFDNYVNETTLKISERFNLYTNALLSIRAFFKSSENVSRLEYQNYINSLETGKNYPHLAGVTVSEKVKATNVAEFVEFVRRDTSLFPEGFPNYKILPTDTGKENFYAVSYIYPYSPTSTTFGLDYSTIVDRFPAIQVAETTGSPAITNRITLLGTNPRPGIILFVPMYLTDNIPSTPEQRQENLTGTVNGIFSTQGLFSDIIHSPNINLALFDSSTLDESHLLYSTSGKVATEEELKNAFYTQTAEVKIADKTWTLQFVATPDFGANTFTRFLPLVVLVGGVVLIILMIGTFYSLVTSEKRANVLADKITSELKRSDAYQSSILNASDYSIIAINSDGIVQLFNKAAEKLLGYTASEVVGKMFPIEIHDKQELVEYADKLSKETGKQISLDHNLFTVRPLQGLPETNDWTYISKDGHKTPVHLSVTAVRDAKGELLGFMTVGKDITAEKAEMTELTTKTQELERINALMINRELKMSEMKRELNTLKGEPNTNV